ncbi:MAG: hypothetical protein WC976_07115 [Caldisericia bacterium]
MFRFKKVVCVIWAIFAVMGLGGQGSGLFAMGIFFQPDAKASAMGSAFVAVADNASAVYWNPAGLLQLSGTGVMITGMASVVDAEGDSLLNTELANVSNGDFPLPKIYPTTEPDKYSSEKLKTSAYLPGVFAYTNIGGISVGIVSQVLGGGGGKWSDRISFPSGEDTITYDDDGNEIIVAAVKDTVAAKVDDEYGFLVSGITVGKEVASGIACAIGLNYIYKTNETTIEKTYVLGPNSALLGSGIGDYRLYYKDEGSGSGIEPIVAVLYKPSNFPAIRMGATYRAGTIVKTDGTVRYIQAGFGDADMDYKTTYIQKYTYPSTLGIGVAYNPLYDFATGSLKNLLIAVGISFSNYSVVKKDTDYKDDSVYADGVEKMGWKDSTQINIGIEYPSTESLSFRCGLTNDANIVKSSDRTLLNTNQYSLLYLTTGVGYTIKKYAIDFYYGHGFSSTAEFGGREYKYPSNDFRLSVSAKLN